MTACHECKNLRKKRPEEPEDIDFWGNLASVDLGKFGGRLKLLRENARARAGASGVEPVVMVSQMPGSQPGAARPAFHEWGGFDSTAPGEGITSRFAASVRAAGSAVAAVEGSTSLTYDELDRRSNQLARFLLRQGVRAGSVVALHAGRSIASVLAILATLKTGAAYMPLDPTAPIAYHDWILRDCGADMVLSGSPDSGVFSVPTINLEDALTARRVRAGGSRSRDRAADRPTSPTSCTRRVRPAGRRAC